MATLSSPGVSVTVVDESFYTPAAPGTVPLIIVASEESKQNGAGTGTAAGTLATNAGKVYLLTSQKDLADTFGTPKFITDANNNPIHAGEQNEYGLQAAYSYLGVSNRAYVVRADVDLAQLDAASDAPAGMPEGGTHWLDTSTTKFGIFEWNAASASAGGQSFNNKVPTVITDTAKVTNFSGSDYSPLASLGAIGDYAVVSVTNLNTVWFKKRKTTALTSGAVKWVEVGSSEWKASWPTVVGTTTPGAGNVTGQLTINGTDLTLSSSTLTDIVDAINGSTALDTAGIKAGKLNDYLEIFSTSSNISFAGTVSGVATFLGISASATYKTPDIKIQPHTKVPQYKSSGDNRPTGSIWIKTTEPNLGARWRVKVYNTSTEAWAEVSAPIYENNEIALANLDPTGGGINLPVGGLYVRSNDDEGTPLQANFKIYARKSIGATKIVSSIIDTGTYTAGDYTFQIAETLKSEETLSSFVTISTGAATSNALTGGPSDANKLAQAINAAGLTNVVAEVDSANRLVIQHNLGGDIRLIDGTGTPLNNIYSTTLTTNFYVDPTGVSNHYLASLWTELSYTASGDAPTTIPADGTLWYDSNLVADIMVHDGDTWVGYLNQFPDTDPAGPQIQATAPLLQSDGTVLEDGDLWVDTSDIENYPRIYRYDAYKTNTPVAKRWTLVDNSDQTTETGILFRDARWGVDGGSAEANEAPMGTIVELLESDFLDPDAPDPALYPQGMLLWNLRRSGYNVKRFVQNYSAIDTTGDNPRADGESMEDYYPHRWVSEAANQEDGSGTFGRKAQRKVVVQALQALVNSNQQIRDEESRVFNLIATPGYPELIGEMVALNYDRSLTAFVVGDTPARLTPDATSLSNWGNNVNNALEDNDTGAASFDEYLGMFYPWGYTSDNKGNNIVVPPSHMMLRTIALSDNVSYPWFAPAGTRRGGITNATAVGYVTDEGEFQSVALNNGQRDTLASIKVNPLTFITGTGLVNYGQYTRAKNASALDRINVARLVIYLRRQFAQLAKPYVFEPNDKITRDEIKGAAESLLLELVGQRALYDYIVVCDESNNYPSRIDKNELYLDVAIEPVKAVEFIYIPLRLKNTGEIAALG